jgi:peptidoglycan/xylan/chitin deacetylase (PgdA/CDA1 family)
MTLPRSYLEYPARRKGMDHDRYGYANLFEHKPVKWPRDARIALIVVPVLEWYPLNMYEDPAAVKVPGGMDRPPPDYWNYTMRDYGTRVGIHRIFRVLDELGMAASVAMNGAIARRHPFLVREVTRRNWELVAYGLDMGHVLHSGLKPGQEEAVVTEALSTLRQASRQAVTGWLSPLQLESMQTLDILSRHGVEYTLDWNIDDLPVRMRGEAGPVYGMPYALDINDKLSVLEFNLTNEAYTEQLTDAFTALWEEAATSGGRMLSIAAHSWISGQANRIGALRRALEFMLSHSGVWVTTFAEALRAYREQE